MFDNMCQTLTIRKDSSKDHHYEGTKRNFLVINRAYNQKIQDKLSVKNGQESVALGNTQ